jgi:serine/threonine protein kinase
MGRIQKLAFQMLKALEFIHSLHLIHADVKPENILIKSFRQTSFKLIDFGSARFVHDELSNYAQCRKYRAPEVILGFHYDFKVDLWSLGCVMFEIFTGKVLFDCNTVQEFLAKVIGLFGQFPEDVYKYGLNCKKYFTKEKVIILELDEKTNFESLRAGWARKKKYKIFIPRKCSLKKKMKCEDLVFVDFVRSLLTPDRYSRLSAAEALKHPFISENRYVDGIE